MTIKEKGRQVVSILAQRYPDSCSLDSQKDYELLFSVRLAAQCTDARVNQITPILFSRYPTLEAIANADADELCEIVRPCGFFRAKGRDIISSARMLIDEYGGVVPDTMEELLRLPGVGRKSANLIISDIYGKPAVVADTHCMRIANRLGLVSCGNDPYKVELALAKVIEPKEQASLCHRFVHFGRDVCTARAPKCGECPLQHLCPSFGKPAVPKKKKT